MRLAKLSLMLCLAGGGLVLDSMWAMSTLGQERAQIAARPRGGGVRLSIAVRRSASQQPRYVVAYRVVEEGESAPPLARETPAEIVEYYQSEAQSAIAQLDALCPLDDALRAKLTLAAMGDMSHLTREAREVQSRFAGVSPGDQAELLAVSAELNRLNDRLRAGLLQPESMFLRVLASSLSAQQRDALLRAQFSRQLDEWSLKLDAGQRERLLELMLEASQEVVEPLMWWEPAACAALVPRIDRRELIKILEPFQLQRLQRLPEAPAALSFRGDGPT